MTIEDFMREDAFALHTGIELVEVKKGYAKARMLIRPSHLNGAGVCQGGAIFTLADLALGAASNSHGRLTLSVNATINYMQSEKEGYLYAEARETLDKKRLSMGEVKVTNQAGDLIATFSSTSYRKEVTLPFTPPDA